MAARQNKALVLNKNISLPCLSHDRFWRDICEYNLSVSGETDGKKDGDKTYSPRQGSIYSDTNFSSIARRF